MTRGNRRHVTVVIRIVVLCCLAASSWQSVRGKGGGPELDARSSRLRAQHLTSSHSSLHLGRRVPSGSLKVQQIFAL